MASIGEKLNALAILSLAQLRGEWLQRFKTPAPSAVGHRLLALGIAYRLQEKQYGGLTAMQTRELDRLGRGQGEARNRADSPVIIIKPGTLLVREWRGKTYHVERSNDGYRYDDRHYGSLSTIAQEITGAKWSGPRFFGLTSRAAKTRTSDHTIQPVGGQPVGGQPVGGQHG